MKKCPKCDGDAIVAIEYAYPSKFRYDGISEFMCYDCKYRQGRFCGQELTGSEMEPAFCEGKKKHPHEVIINDEKG